MRVVFTGWVPGYEEIGCTGWVSADGLVGGEMAISGVGLAAGLKWRRLWGTMNTRFSAMLHIPGDVREAIAFYQRAFGATTGWSTPEAKDMVAQLLVGGAEFWLHPADRAIDNPSPAELGGTAVRLMLIVEDLDAVFASAVAAGATVRSAVKDHNYGWRDGSVMDPFGHRWEIGRPL